MAVLAIGVLLSIVVPVAQAQEPVDTTQTPTGVEPADLDTLPTGELRTPGAPPDSAQPAPDTAETQRVSVNADSLVALQEDGERIQELFGNVFVQQGTTRLHSDYARRYRTRDVLLFIENVVIYERGDTLRADTVRYNRATEVGRARGNVRLTDGDVHVRADRGTYYAEEQRSVFPDSVVLVDSTRILRARHGTYWSDEQRAEFGGSVRLTEPGTTILSDSLTYYRDTDRSVARGEVVIERQRGGEMSADSTTQTYLFGDWVDNREQQRYSRVHGHALLVQIRTDSTGAPTDTLIVQSRRLEAFRTDTHRRLIAVDSVRIWQSNLSAVADSVVYDRVVATTPDSVEGETVPIDTTRPPPDSLSLIATAQSSESERSAQSTPDADSLRNAPGNRTQADVSEDSTLVSTSQESQSPDSLTRPDTTAQTRTASGTQPSISQWTTPTAQSEVQLPLEETRLFQNPMTWFEDSQVWGDSIRVLARNRSPDTVFVRGSAFSVRRDTALDRLNQLKARNLTAFFRSDSLRRIVAQPNARAIYFLASEADSILGAKRASGDRFLLYFSDGSVQQAVWKGGVEGVAYPNIEDIPTPFELEGFQWTPERRPTRTKLLRDERVRRRLDLDPSPRSRPLARRPRASGSGQRESLLAPEQPDSSNWAPERDTLPSVPPPPPDSMRQPSEGILPSDTTKSDPDPDV